MRLTINQSMQHLLTEECVYWQGFGRQIAQEANELLGGADAVLIFDESGFAKKGGATGMVSASWWKSSHCPERRENVGEGKGVQRNSE